MTQPWNTSPFGMPLSLLGMVLCEAACASVPPPAPAGPPEVASTHQYEGPPDAKAPPVAVAYDLDGQACSKALLDGRKLTNGLPPIGSLIVSIDQNTGDPTFCRVVSRDELPVSPEVRPGVQEALASDRGLKEILPSEVVSWLCSHGPIERSVPLDLTYPIEDRHLGATGADGTKIELLSGAVKVRGTAKLGVHWDSACSPLTSFDMEGAIAVEMDAVWSVSKLSMGPIDVKITQLPILVGELPILVRLGLSVKVQQKGTAAVAVPIHLSAESHGNVQFSMGAATEMSAAFTPDLSLKVGSVRAKELAIDASVSPFVDARVMGVVGARATAMNALVLGWTNSDRCHASHGLALKVEARVGFSPILADRILAERTWAGGTPHDQECQHFAVPTNVPSVP